MKQVGNEVFAQYDISIKKIQYSRSNYYLDTKQGQLLLRKTLIPKEQIVFEHEVTQQLLEKGFSEINKIYLSKKQVPYGACLDKCFILQAYDKMTEIDFANQKELKAIIEVLARFHVAANHIESKVRDIDSVGPKNIYEYFQKRMLDAKRMKKKISGFSQKTKFEIMFLDSYKAYEDLQYKAIDLVTHDIADQLIEKAKVNKTILHNDFTYHAVGKIDETTYKITNLDNCTYNIQLLDLANVLTKIMQKNNWDINMLDYLINSYTRIHTLEQEEIRALKAMLIFPEKYSNICFKYATSKHRNNYSMFEHKWENMLVYKEDQIRASEELIKYL
ncbi:MAG: hypothetical protein RR887_05365 [Niameybacter sp.]